MTQGKVIFNFILAIVVLFVYSFVLSIPADVSMGFTILLFILYNELDKAE